MALALYYSPKVQNLFYLWLASKNKLLTNVERFKRQMCDVTPWNLIYML